MVSCDSIDRILIDPRPSLGFCKRCIEIKGHRFEVPKLPVHAILPRCQVLRPHPSHRRWHESYKLAGQTPIKLAPRFLPTMEIRCFLPLGSASSLCAHTSPAPRAARKATVQNFAIAFAQRSSSRLFFTFFPVFFFLPRTHSRYFAPEWRVDCTGRIYALALPMPRTHRAPAKPRLCTLGPNFWLRNGCFFTEFRKFDEYREELSRFCFCFCFCLCLCLRGRVYGV